MSANYREPQLLLPNCKNLKLPGTGTSVGSGLTEDRHSLYSMDFDGNNDYIDTGYAFTSLTSFSISAWFKSDDTSTAAQAIVSSRINSIGTSQGLDLNISSDILYARVFNNGATEVTTAFTDTASWHHVAMIYNGTTLEMYLDGVSKGTATGVYTNSAANWLIGKWNAGANYFNGKIDETAIFSRALSTSEITTLYNNGAPSNPMLLSGKPIAYYPLGEQARKPGTAEWRFPNEVLQGQAINFDGTDHISASLNNVFNSATQSTISFWAKKSSSSHEIVLGAGTDVSHSIYILWYSNGYVYFGTRATGATGFNINYIFSGSDKLNKWHHFMGVYNAGTASLYINGSLVSGPTSGGPSALENNIDSTFTIGRLGDVTTYNSTGEMSNVAIWDTDQSANITNIYNYGAPQTSYTVTPTAWYKLDKTSTFTGLNPNWHSALSFDGNNDTIQSSAVITIKSVSLWFKPDSTITTSTSNGCPISFGTTDFRNAIYLGSNFSAIPNELITVMDQSTNRSYYSQSGGSISASWHHLAIVHDGTKYQIYLDGSALTTTGSTSLITSQQVLIGARSDSSSYFNGEISNVAIYDQVISAEDIKYLYNGGTPQTNISFEPTSWYKLDNLTTGIQDSGSASNNGTNNGATEVASNVAVDEWVFENTVQSQTPNWTSALDFGEPNTGGENVNVPVDIGGLTKCSVSVWFKTPNPDARQAIYATGGNNGNFHFYFWDAGSGILYAGVNNIYAQNNTVNTLIPFDKWTHLSIVYDGTFTDSDTAVQNAGRLKMYINSSYVPFTSFSSTIPASISSAGSTNINIGSYGATTYEFGGQLSNFNIYNTNLSQSEINSLYNNGQPPTTLVGSPMGSYALDSTTITDSSGNGNTGTNNGATEIQTNVWTPRLNGESDTLPSTALVNSDLQFNSAYSSFSLDFDGTDDIDCGNISTLNGASTATFSAWFNTDVTSVLILMGTDTQFYIQVWAANNRIDFITPAATQYRTTAPTINDGEWYHLAIVFNKDGGSHTERYKGYINGVYYANERTTSTSDALPTTSNSFKIGKYGSIGSQFNGKIDEVSVFNKVLNQTEITSIYNNGYPKDITALAPVSWWRLGEDAYFNGNDFIIPNQITGAPNGTSNGMPATALVADAPGSYAAGLGSSLVETDRLGDAPLSTANSLSFNMTPENKISYPAGYVPAQANNIYSMAFDGSNDYVNAGTSLFTGSNISSISISAWIKTTVGQNGNVIVCKDLATNGNRNFLFQLASNNVYWQHSTNGNGLSSLIVNQSTYDVVDGNWHHIVVTYEAGSTSGTAEKKIYIDGEVRATDPAATLNNIVNTTSVPIEIGRRGDQPSGARYFNGNIDEVAIFDYALSARQVKEDIYNGTTSGKTADLNNNSNLTPPIAWYRMGD